ncbi:membrane protein [Thermaurantimonas aggregans]|uniref:Membrane protein n=1 Tax=Thermaurantimonas aggregans TaxID=2173829 RepID=A0A401XLI2_9FLAO|nr:AsmA-like C-terminal region-containing protein [Thermaurantimonas aggregans]GCD77862.1 membrane protein [Thermaurantimonas aggregans]
MKRAGKIFLILFALIVVIVLVAPFVFKDEIVRRFKEEVNQQLLADVDFGDFRLSLIRDFPNLHFGVHDFVITGRDTFAGVELARIGEFDLSLDILSVFKGDQFKIRKIGIEDASFHLIALDSNLANYLIVPTTEGDTKAEEDTTTTTFSLALKKYYLRNVNLTYDDRYGGIYTAIRNLNHEGRGDFTQDIVDLKTKTTIDTFDFRTGGVTMLHKVRVASDFDVRVNQQTMEIALGDNFISLNDLRLNFKGLIRMPEDDIDLDLEFDAPNTSFKSIISLIPAIYYQDFHQLTARGTARLEGKVQGIYNGDKEIYPKFNILLSVRDGFFKYPDLPSSVDAVNTDIRVSNTGGSLDNTLLSVPSFAMKLANNPIAASLTVSTPISDPYIDFTLNGKLDLAEITRLVPLDPGMQLAGLIDAAIALKTKLSAIESEKYDQVTAEGRATIANFVYSDPSTLTLPVKIASAALQIRPENFQLDNLVMTIGRTDISATGRFDNLLSYVFKDTTLYGRFTVSSTLFDLNELADLSADTAATATADTVESNYIRLPEKIDFRLTAQAQRVLFSNFDISDFSGAIALTDQKALMENVRMTLIGGRVLLNGFYDSKPQVPTFNFSMNLENFGLRPSFQTFNTIQSLAPIAENSEGTFNTSFTISGPLTRDMMPDLTRISSTGSLRTFDVLLRSQALAQIGTYLRNQDYSTLALRDANISYKIENGRIHVAPFQVRTGNLTGTISGSNGLDQTLDYDLDLKIPGTAIRAEQLLASIGGRAPQTIDLKVKITGTYTNPKVSTSLGNLVGDLVSQVKEQVREKVEQKVEDLKQQVNAEAERIMANARAQADQILAQAQQQADRVRAEAKAAADRLRAEGRTQAQRIRDEAKGNIIKERAAAEAARRVEQEAENKALKLEEEANRRAEQILQQARDQSNQILSEAENKAKVR